MIKRGRREFTVLLLEMFVHVTESVCVLTDGDGERSQNCSFCVCDPLQ